MDFRPRRFARVFAWCLLLTLGTGALANAAEMLGHVLCIGDDGHVAVERIVGNDCDTAHAHAPPPAAPAQSGAPLVQATHCGGCTDIELSGTSAISNPQVAKAFDRTADDEPPFMPAPVVRIAAHATACQLPPLPAVDLPNITLIERRTVVLIV